MSALGEVRCPECGARARPIANPHGDAGCGSCGHMYGPWITRALHHPSSTPPHRPHLGRDSQPDPPGATMRLGDHANATADPHDEAPPIDNLVTSGGESVAHWSSMYEETLAAFQYQLRRALDEVAYFEGGLAVWREQTHALQSAMDALLKARDSEAPKGDGVA